MQHIVTNELLRRGNLSAMLLCCLFLANCEDSKLPGDESNKSMSAEDLWPSDQSSRDSIEQRSKAVTAKFSSELRKLQTDNCIAVCRNEWITLTGEYTRNFKVFDGTNYDDVPMSTIKVPWSVFRNKVMGKSPIDKIRGLVFHYGLDGNGRIALGVNVVFMKAPFGGDPWTFDESTGSFYIIDDDKMKDADLSDWDDYKKAYLTQVKVSRTGNGADFIAMDNCDHKSYFMPWDFEVFHLGDMNKPAAGTDVIFSIGAMMTTTANDGNGTAPANLCTYPTRMRQTLIMHLDGYLNNNALSANDPPLLGRGVDLGTPCPPRCKKWSLPVEGDRCGSPTRCQAAMPN
jgi:hypothetical protein